MPEIPTTTYGFSRNEYIVFWAFWLTLVLGAVGLLVGVMWL